MKKYSSILGLVLLSLGCTDIIEENITEDTILTYYPSEDSIIEGNNVQFRWQELQGANSYQLQVMDEYRTLVIDSVVSTTTLTNSSLETGSYQWRVRGVNDAYETGYTGYVNFQLFPFLDLTDQQVALLTPVEDLVTNDITDFRFSWEPIETATHYEFEILNSTNDAIVYSDTEVTSSELQFTENVLADEGDGTYTWQVRAHNTSSSSSFYARSMQIDTQVPPTPVLSTPVNGTEYTFGDPVTLTWSFEDFGVVQSDILATIEVASDTAFNNVVRTEVNLAASTLTFTPTTTGTLYWRVKGIDEATNEGEYSTINSFIVN